MNDRSSNSTAIPRPYRILMWSIAALATAIGVVLAIATSSLLPLFAVVGGFAIPFIPYRTSAARRARGAVPAATAQRGRY